MPIALILIGAILIVVAFRDTMGQLAKELQADVPGYFIWIVAIAAILGLGYIPALKTPSRWLLALVALVIVLTNYKQILAGFQQFAASGGQPTGTVAPDPATAYATGNLPTQAQVSGTAGSGPQTAAAQTSAGLLGGILGGNGSALGGIASGAASSAAQAATVPIVANYADPLSYVGALSSSIGFGGLL
ncbi:MAG: hypothetical protein C5B60_01755 [Chloroflexi bacterium]|nr:MAG: hypothetical protein C5B60_01755 [Chloroflexota bacterium]